MARNRKIWSHLRPASTSRICRPHLTCPSVYRDRNALKNVDVRSHKAEYDLAAELGLASKSQVVCRQRYSTCPFTADEMMKALRTANL